MKCNRSVGNVSANGNLEFSNTRVLSFEKIQHTFDSQHGREISFQRVCEKRSLCGKYEGSKRISSERFDGFEPLTKRISTELQCFQARVYPDCEICAIDEENRPIIPDDESDFDDIPLHDELSEYLLFPPSGDEWVNYDDILRRDTSLRNGNRSPNVGSLFSDNDAFFNQDTVPFPFNAMPNNMPDVALSDYESVSYEIDYFARPYDSPPNVYHFADDDVFHYVPPLRDDIHSLDDEEPYSSPSASDYHELENTFDDQSDLLPPYDIPTLQSPIINLNSEMIEFFMQYLPFLNHSIVFEPFPAEE